MIRTRNQAIAASLKQTTNDPGMCQATVRGWFNAPSVGDVDGDKRADAEDGWKSEPFWARVQDRNAPAGVPLSFLGGSNDDGHRALMLPHGRVRSTDFDTATQRYRRGVVGTANSIAAVERALGVQYVGWSKTISGREIPEEPDTGRPKKVQDLIDDTKELKKKAKQKGQTTRVQRYKNSLAWLRQIGKKK